MAIAYTTVINKCGGKKLFSFLPPHGVELDVNCAICYVGEITNRLIPSWPYHTDKDRPPNPVKVKALQEAAHKGQLIIVRSLRVPRHEQLTKLIHRTKSLGRIDPISIQEGTSHA